MKYYRKNDHGKRFFGTCLITSKIELRDFIRREIHLFPRKNEALFMHLSDRKVHF